MIRYKPRRLCEILFSFKCISPWGNQFVLQVNWNPWGTNESDMPEAVINSVSATRKRILLEGPAGSAWFLGERVAMQSLGTTEPQVPKIPPTTMLSDYKLNDEAEVREALNGYPASEWLANSSNYGHYRDEYIRYRHYEDLREAVRYTLNTCSVLTLAAWNSYLNWYLNSTGRRRSKSRRGQ